MPAHTISFLARCLLFWLIVAGSGCLLGQQQPQWTQYMLNKYTVNPAYAGLDKSLSITTGIRSQWSGFEGAPKTQFVNAHLPLYFIQGSVGVGIVNDQVGAIGRTEFAASYNYVMDTDIGLFSAGIRVGAQQVRLQSNRLRTPDGIYQGQLIDHQDPLLGVVNPTGMSPIWSLGVYYVRELLEVGVAFDNFPEVSLSAGATTYSSTQNMSLLASYQYPVTDLISIEPNIFIKTDGVQTQVDIGLMGYYKTVFAGLGIRGIGGNSQDALGIIAGARLSEKVRLSYSFDVGLSAIRDFHDGTHEFIFNYNLSKPIRTGELPPIIYNPRYR